MTNRLRVDSRNRVTLPKETPDKALFEYEMTPEGRVLLTPCYVVPVSAVKELYRKLDEKREVAISSYEDLIKQLGVLNV